MLRRPNRSLILDLRLFVFFSRSPLSSSAISSWELGIAKTIGFPTVLDDDELSTLLPLKTFPRRHRHRGENRPEKKDYRLSWLGLNFLWLRESPTIFRSFTFWTATTPERFYASTELFLRSEIAFLRDDKLFLDFKTIRRISTWHFLPLVKWNFSIGKWKINSWEIHVYRVNKDRSVYIKKLLNLPAALRKRRKEF